MMINYTLITKKHHCPVWDIDLTITAKYSFFDKENPYIAKFMQCTCPIIENLKKPLHKRNEDYNMFYHCEKHIECLKSIEFDNQIDVSKNDYSQ